MTLDYHTIGKRIKRRRNQCQMTQEKLAELCNVSEQYISNIERAVSDSSTEVIMRLAAILDTTPDEFLVGTIRREGARRGKTRRNCCAGWRADGWSWRRAF